MNGETDTGFVLMHEAFEEDKRAGGEDKKWRHSETLPAWRFIILDYESQEQYWVDLVRDLALFLDACISEYRKACAGTLDLTGFRSHFLQKQEYREAVFFFVYSLWKFRHHLRTAGGLTTSSFSVLLQLDAALNLYVILEEVLKRYYGGKLQLHNLIECFSKKHDLGVHKCAPGRRKSRIVSLKEEFDDVSRTDQVISQILASSKKDFNSVEAALSIAPKLRNAAAHRVRSYPAFAGNAPNYPATSLERDICRCRVREIDADRQGIAGRNYKRAGRNGNWISSGRREFR